MTQLSERELAAGHTQLAVEVDDAPLAVLVLHSGMNADERCHILPHARQDETVFGIAEPPPAIIRERDERRGEQVLCIRQVAPMYELGTTVRTRTDEVERILNQRLPGDDASVVRTFSGAHVVCVNDIPAVRIPSL